MIRRLARRWPCIDHQRTIDMDLRVIFEMLLGLAFVRGRMRSLSSVSRKWRARFLTALLPLVLAGCAVSPRSDVQVVSTAGAVAGSSRSVHPAGFDPRALGRDDAPVAIVEYSDYQCPYCQKFHAEVLPQLRRQYIDTGKLRYFFRDLPLSMHREAVPAAVAARCAAEQEKFWPMNAALFAKQGELGAGLYPRLARELGLDGDRFKTCFGNPATRGQVRRDLTESQRYGLNSTPSFLLGRYNGERLEVQRIGQGFADFATLAREIDQLLAAPAESRESAR